MADQAAFDALVAEAAATNAEIDALKGELRATTTRIFAALPSMDEARRILEVFRTAFLNPNLAEEHVLARVKADAEKLSEGYWLRDEALELQKLILDVYIYYQ